MARLLALLVLLACAPATADPVDWFVLVKPPDTEDAVFVPTRVAVEHVHEGAEGSRHEVEPGAFARVEAALRTGTGGGTWVREVAPAGQKRPKRYPSPHVWGADRKVLHAYQPWLSSYPPERPKKERIERPVPAGAVVWDPLVLTSTTAWALRLTGDAPVSLRVLDAATGDAADVTASPKGASPLRQGDATVQVPRWEVSLPDHAAPLELYVHAERGLVAVRQGAMTAVMAGFAPIYPPGRLGGLGTTGGRPRPKPRGGQSPRPGPGR